MNYQQITLDERCMIYGFCKAGFTPEKIAQELGRSKSTIYRELKRNSGLKGYRPKQANELALYRRHNGEKHTKFSKFIIRKIIPLIKDKWSPEQISERLKLFYNISISHERIYQFIYDDKANGGDLFQYLRQAKKKRRKKYGKNSSKRGEIRNKKPIGDRPEYINNRSTYGHWEGDTIIGKNHKEAIITLVERKSGYCIMKKIISRNSKLVSRAISNVLQDLKPLVKSITFDNGLEFANHEEIAKALNCTIYFADPYCSHQRGTNENTNGLIRQYFPKGYDFRKVSNKDVKQAMKSLNNRPRKRLEFYTPVEVFL